MKIDDTGADSAILEILSRLVAAVNVDKFPSRIRPRAGTLKTILEGIFECLEAHAIRKRPGLARVLYNEISGVAGLPVIKRIEAASLACEKPSPRAAGSGGGLGGSGGFRRGGRGRGGAAGLGGSGKRDLSSVTCYSCFKKGHYRNACPEGAQADGKE